MFPPFPEEEAFAACKIIISQIDDGSLVLKQVAPVSEERGDHGVMLGVLVAHDADGKKYILQTVSGISKALACPSSFLDADSIYVEPIVSSEQIEKALLKNDKKIHELTQKINKLKLVRKQKREESKSSALTSSESIGKLHCCKDVRCDEEKKLVASRAELTTESLNNVFDLYSFHCADGSIKSLNEICAERCNGKLPPTGTGDCCAPKLLDYAFSHHLIPKSMCEVFYGKTSKNKISGMSYSPCDARCGIVLPAMLGIEILYRDKDIIVVNKQSGLLSVPGRGPEKQDCVVNRVRRLFPECIAQPSVHRLDMETSGLLVLAFTEDAHRGLCRQFEKRLTNKKYMALVDGNLIKSGVSIHGEMELFFRLDIDNRPHQIWDTVYGKSAVTEWNIIDTEKYTSCDGKKRIVTRIEFIPHTGRTHQLRLASSDSHGFGVPIVGDTLYGHCKKGERLMLHAEYLQFIHPITECKMEFYCKSSF